DVADPSLAMNPQRHVQSTDLDAVTPEPGAQAPPLVHAGRGYATGGKADLPGNLLQSGPLRDDPSRSVSNLCHTIPTALNFHISDARFSGSRSDGPHDSTATTHPDPVPPHEAHRGSRGGRRGGDRARRGRVRSGARSDGSEPSQAEGRQ